MKTKSVIKLIARALLQSFILKNSTFQNHCKTVCSPGNSAFTVVLGAPEDKAKVEPNGLGPTSAPYFCR